MSITNVREHFQKGLGDSAACIRATMDYVDGGRVQRFTFLVRKPDGQVVAVTEDVGAREVLETKAVAMGQEYVRVAAIEVAAPGVVDLASERALIR
ncbi:MAG: hypothetical protein ACRCZI_01000 [Cetobacterium sp.]